MKINKPEINNGLPLNQTKPTLAGHQNIKPSNQNIPTRVNLAKTYAEMGLDISSAVSKSVSEALISVGIPLSGLSGISAVRVLILTELGVPLSKELIENDFSLKIFPEISGIASEALNLTSNTNLSPETKAALMALSGDLKGLYDFPENSVVLKEILSETAAIWASEMSSLIKVELPEKYEQFIKAANELISSLNSIENFNIKGKEKLDQILAKFFHDFGLNPDYSRIAVDSATTSNALKFGEIEKKLHRIFQSFTENDFGSIKGDTLSANEIAGLLRKTGMSFEWRLLAWYRSGKDPAKLRELFRNNLKGILLSFLKNSDKNKGVNTVRILAGIREKATIVLNELESRQLSEVINEHAEKRGFFIELPIERNGDNGTAKMWVRGDKEKGLKAISSEYFHLDFELETASAGLIKGELSSAGKSLSVKFNFGDERTRKIAENMASELQDALHSKGFSLRGLDFSDIRKLSSHPADIHKKDGLDITG